MPTRYDIAAGTEYLLPFAKKKLRGLRERAAAEGVNFLRSVILVESGQHIYLSVVGEFEGIRITGEGFFAWAFLGALEEQHFFVDSVVEEGALLGGFEWVGLAHETVDAASTTWATDPAVSTQLARSLQNNKDIIAYSGSKSLPLASSPTMYFAFLSDYRSGGEFEYAVPSVIDGVSIYNRYDLSSPGTPQGVPPVCLLSRNRQSILSLLPVNRIGYSPDAVLHRHGVTKTRAADGTVATQAVTTLLHASVGKLVDPTTGVRDSASTSPDPWHTGKYNPTGPLTGIAPRNVDRRHRYVVWGEQFRTLTGGAWPSTTEAMNARLVKLDTSNGETSIIATAGELGFGRSAPPSGYQSGIYIGDTLAMEGIPTVDGDVWHATFRKRQSNTVLTTTAPVSYFVEPDHWGTVELGWNGASVASFGAFEGGWTNLSGHALSRDGALFAVQAITEGRTAHATLPYVDAVNSLVRVYEQDVVPFTVYQLCIARRGEVELITTGSRRPLCFDPAGAALLCADQTTVDDQAYIVYEFVDGTWVANTVVDSSGVVIHGTIVRDEVAAFDERATRIEGGMRWAVVDSSGDFPEVYEVRIKKASLTAGAEPVWVYYRAHLGRASTIVDLPPIPPIPPFFPGFPGGPTEVPFDVERVLNEPRVERLNTFAGEL